MPFVPSKGENNATSPPGVDDGVDEGTTNITVLENNNTASVDRRGGEVRRNLNSDLQIDRCNNNNTVVEEEEEVSITMTKADPSVAPLPPSDDEEEHNNANVRDGNNDTISTLSPWEDIESNRVGALSIPGVNYHHHRSANNNGTAINVDGGGDDVLVSNTNNIGDGGGGNHNPSSLPPSSSASTTQQRQQQQQPLPQAIPAENIDVFDADEIVERKIFGISYKAAVAIAIVAILIVTTVSIIVMVGIQNVGVMEDILAVTHAILYYGLIFVVIYLIYRYCNKKRKKNRDKENQQQQQEEVPNTTTTIPLTDENNSNRNQV